MRSVLAAPLAFAALTLAFGPPCRSDEAPARTPPPAGPVSIDADVAAIRAETDPVKRRAAIASLHAKAPEALLALPAGTLAALAPDVLRVYDLGAALAEGADDPEPPTLDIVAEGEHRTIPAPEGPGPRTARRITEVIRAAWGPDAPGGAARLVDVRPGGERTGLVVLADDAGFAAAEAMLDRLAATGEPSRLVTVRLLVSEALVPALHVEDLPVGGARPAPPSLPTEAALAGAEVARFALPVTRGRRASAWRAVGISYVQDADSPDSKSDTIDPVVGTLRTGLSVSAVLERGEGTVGDLLRLRLARAEPRTLPFEQITTTLASPYATQPVTIELPELGVRRCEATIALGAGPGRFVVREAGTEACALVDVGAPEAGRKPAGRGWARVAADAADPAAVQGPAITFRARISADEASDAPTVSTVSVLEGQTGAVDVLSQVAYVADFDVDAQHGIADPIVGALPEGTRIEVTPRARVDGRRTVDVVVRTHRIDRPVRRFSFPVRPRSPVQIDLPVAREVVRPYRATLAPGASVALPCFLPRVGAPPRPATLTLEYVGDEATGAREAATPELPPPGADSSAKPSPARPSDAILGAIRDAHDANAQAVAVETARAASEPALLSLEPTELARLAPEVLHVYDLAGALEGGGDDPIPEGLSMPGGPDEHPGEIPSSATRRAQRIARELEHVLSEAAGHVTPTFVLLRPGGGAPHDLRRVHAMLVVLGPPAAFAEVERALDRLATTGGPVLRLRVDVLRDDALYRRLALEKGGRPLSAVEREALTGLESARIARFEMDVSHQRSVTAWRDVRSAFLAGLDTANPVPVPRGIVGHGREALVVRGLVEAGANPEEPKLWVSLGTATGGGPVAPPAEPAPAPRTPGWSGPEARLRWVDAGFLVGNAAVDAVESMEDRSLVALLHAERLPGPFAPVARGWVRVEQADPLPTAPPDALTISVTLRDAESDAVLGQGRMGAATGQEVAFEQVRRTAILGDAVVTLAAAPQVRTEARMLVDGVLVTLTAGKAADGRRVITGLARTRWHDLPLRLGALTLSSGAHLSVHLPVEREVARPFRVELAPGAEARVPVRAVRPDGTTTAATLVVRYVGDGLVPDLGVPAPK